MLAPRLLLPLSLLLCCSLGHADEPVHYPPDRPIDVERIDLDLHVDLKAKRIKGSATLTVRAQTDLQRFALDAVEHEIEGISSGEPPQAIRYAYDGKRIVLERPLKRDERLRFAIRYAVEDPTEGLYFFAPSEERPQVPYQVWSQGEPTSNRYWFPSVDHPDERQATSMTVRVAKGLTVVSNGVHLGTEPKDDASVWRFAQEREHVAYLVTLVVGTFAKVEAKPWRGKPIAYYVPPARKDDALRSFGRTHEMLDLFSKLTGVEYPWPKYEQIVVEQFVAGGMENTGATTLNERTLHDERAHLDYSSEGLVAHELAHQWFGDLITCREWAHVWLNESFATYFDALWTEHSQGADAYAYELLKNSEGGMRAGEKRPIIDRRYKKPWDMFDGRAYPKGSCVLHMLRRQLGDEVFWRGVQAYVKSFADKSVETVDLRRSLEQASGRNLERFFTQWTQRPGHPVLQVRLSREPKRGLLRVTIEQTQQGPAYHFPAELLFRFGDREVRQTLDVREKKEELLLPASEAPSYFRFDPREAVILKQVEVHKSRALWIEQLKSGDLVGRIRAARALARDRRPKALDALAAQLKSEKSHLVRLEIARELGGVSGKTSQVALLAAYADDDPLVRRAAAEALRRHGREPKVASVFAARLEAGDPSYYVEAATLEAYASVAEAPRDLLLAALKRESHNDVIRQAAIDGLSSLDDPSLAPALVAFTHGRHRNRTRGKAARALSVVGLPGATKEQQEQARIALAPLLRSRTDRLRRTALETLGLLGDVARPLLGEIDRLAQTDPDAGIKKQAGEVASRIRSGAPPQEQLRRLEEARRRFEEEARALKERLGAVEKELEAHGKASPPRDPAKAPKKARKRVQKRKD